MEEEQQEDLDLEEGTTPRAELTEEKWQRLRTAYGKDWDGKMTSDQLAQACRVLDYNPTVSQVQRMREFVEEQRGGEIEAEEFDELMKEHFGMPEDEISIVKDALETMFKDSPGYIDAEQFRAAMKDKGDDPLTDEEIQSLFDQIDLNDDGKIDKDELAKVLCHM